MILEAYYEPQFSDRSHGFRPGRGCHTALSNVTTYWTGTRWFVEGDIKGCFDNIDHDVLLSMLGERLHDNRFLRLLRYLLKAGYVEDWKYGRTLSGTPQGGIVSPHPRQHLPRPVGQVCRDCADSSPHPWLRPERQPRVHTFAEPSGRQRKRGNHAEALQLRKQMQQLPSRDPYDPGYRRLRYVRYADDFVLGFIGPKVEAQQVRESLETSPARLAQAGAIQGENSHNPRHQPAARFLGYELVNQQANDQIDRNGRRRVNGQIGLRVPAQVIEQHCRAYMDDGKPAHRNSLIHDDDFSIVSKYQSEFRGVVNYYLLAHNVSHFGKLRGIMELSLTKTLAAKHKTSARKMHRRYAATADTEHGPRACLKVVVQRDDGKRPLVAQFGGIPPETATTGHPRRPTASTVQERPQRASQTAPSGRMRDVRVNGGHTSSPHPCAPRPERERSRSKVQVGTTHGGKATQDPRGLPSMSHGHPRGATADAARIDHLGITTGFRPSLIV